MTSPDPIARIEDLRLSAQDEAAIAALLEASFGTDFGGRSYFMQRHHVRLVQRTDGRIIGHVGLTYRSVRQGARLIPVIGLADVATDPGHRGQGVAARLLQAAIAEARDSPAEFVLLFGTARLYAAAGFAPAGNRLRFVDLTDARTGAADEVSGSDLMVLSVRGGDWDGVEPVDLVGHLF